MTNKLTLFWYILYRFNARMQPVHLPPPQFGLQPLAAGQKCTKLPRCNSSPVNLPLHFPATWSRFVQSTIQIFTEMWSRFVGEAIQIFQVEIPNFLWRQSVDYRRAQRAPSWIFWNFPIMYFSIFRKAFLYFSWRGAYLWIHGVCDSKLDRQRHLILGLGGVLSCIYIKPISAWLKNGRLRGARILANLTRRHSGHAGLCPGWIMLMLFYNDDKERYCTGFI